MTPMPGAKPAAGAPTWLAGHVRSPKGPDYADRVLGRYRMGARAHGAIRGVRVLAGGDSCPACQAAAERVYTLDDAPTIPIAGCTNSGGCRCAYVPVMAYDADA